MADRGETRRVGARSQRSSYEHDRTGRTTGEGVRSDCTFHLDYYPFSVMSRQSTPFLTTLHGRLDLPEHEPVFSTFPNVPLVSISNAQRRPAPNANWIGTVHHGMPWISSSPCRQTPPISLFWVAFRQRNGSTARSILPSAADYRSRSRRKSTQSIMTISRRVIKSAARQTACRIHRGDLRRAEVRILEQRARADRADRLAGAFWTGHDRSHGLRRAGHCVQPRRGRLN